jgi:uncharacterized protein (DUF1810 family)
MQPKRCPVFVDGKECSRELTEVEVEVKKLARCDLVTYKMQSRSSLLFFTRAEKLKARSSKMLTFHCSDCNETINCGDYESADQIFGRLEDHVKKCSEATFSFDGTTDVARQRVGAWRSVIEKEHLVGRLR